MNSDKKQFYNLYDGYYPGFIFSARNVGPWGEMQNKYGMSTLWEECYLSFKMRS